MNRMHRLLMKSPLLAGASLAFSIMTPFASCGDPNAVVIGSKMHTESYLVATLASMTIEAAGIPTRERFGVGSMIARQGLLNEQIDLYPEYTGTAWNLYLGRDEKIDDPARLYTLVREADAKRGVTWLEQSGVNNTYALALTRERTREIGTTLSDLARFIRDNPGRLKFGVDHEFYQRPDGFRKMLEYYDMPVNDESIATMDIGLSFESIARGQIDVAMVYSTDGKLIKYDLVVLEDDRRFFPVYELCFNLNANVLTRRPELRRILAPLAARLDNQTMQRLNYEVDGLGKPVRMVAEEFLYGKSPLESY